MEKDSDKKVVYMSPEMREFDKALTRLEISIAESPWSEFFVEASVMLYSMRVRHEVCEAFKLLPDKVNLEYYLSRKQRIRDMESSMGRYREDISDIVYALTEEQEGMHLPGLLEGLGEDSVALREVVERLQSKSDAVCEYYEMCMDELDYFLSELGRRKYGEDDFLRMVLDQHRCYWERVWHKEAVALKDDLDSLDSEEERLLQLRSERRKLNKRMANHRFSGLQSDFLDDDGKQCRYEDMFRELYRMRGMRWTVEELNEYFDIVMMRRFVEDMLNGKKGVLKYHPLWMLEPMGEGVAQDHPNWDIYRDMELMLRNVGGCVRKPYTIDYVLDMVRGMLVGEATLEGDGEVQREFVKFITNGTVKAKRMGRIGLNHFYRFVKLLIEKGLMQLDDTYGGVIKRAVGDGWAKDWNISTFEGCLSESWSTKMGVKFPMIGEWVDGYMRRNGK